MELLPTVVIIGRPNVGKSTLFNRIAGKRHAIVTSTAGTTRDRIYSEAEWKGNHFQMIDTGGWMPESGSTIEQLINQQIIIALQEAQLILFVCNAKEGCTSLDIELARMLRKYNKPVFLCINKIDSVHKSHLLDSDFYKLGFETFFTVSAEHGLSIDEILDNIIIILPKHNASAEPERIKVTIVGRPNVGKSSIINAILGQERLIISETPGTTRDSIDITFRYNDTDYCFIDTAGIKKKSKAKDIPELISIIKAKQNIERTDIVLLVIDSTTPIQHLEASIAGYAYHNYKPIGLIINKVDLLEHANLSQRTLKQEIINELRFIAFAPLIFTSARTHYNIQSIFKIIEDLYSAYTYRIPTHSLNEIFNKELKEFTLGKYKNRPIKIKYLTQVGIKPPTYSAFIHKKIKPKSHQITHLENIIRKYYDFMRIPLKLTFKLIK